MLKNDMLGLYIPLQCKQNPSYKRFHYSLLELSSILMFMEQFLPACREVEACNRLEKVERSLEHLSLDSSPEKDQQHTVVQSMEQHLADMEQYLVAHHLQSMEQHLTAMEQCFTERFTAMEQHFTERFTNIERHFTEHLTRLEAGFTTLEQEQGREA